MQLPMAVMNSKDQWLFARRSSILPAINLLT